MANLAVKLRESADTIASMWCEPGALSDGTLLDSMARLRDHITLAQSMAATLAGEIETRSARDLGHSGLAARNGFRSPQQLIQTITKSTKAESIALVDTGRLLRDAALAPVAMTLTTGAVDDSGCPVPLVDETGAPVIELVEVNPTPWLLPVARAVAAGELSAAAAGAIRRGVGHLHIGGSGGGMRDDSGGSGSGSLHDTERGASAGDSAGDSASEFVSTVSADDLLRVTEQLLKLSSRLNADQLFKRARQLRDEIDSDGVAERERAQHEARYFTMWERPDGAVAGSFLYGAEDGALLIAAVNAALSPRRGGPRFVDPAAKAAAEAMVSDARTNKQLQADAFIAALRLAVDADPNRIFGHNRPAVKVLIINDALQPDEEGARHGFGRIEGTHEAVSLATIDRHHCDSGTIGISFAGDGHALSLGRETRLFSRKQREVMAARDGGCIGSADCTMPPAMCEAHHIDQWSRDGGRTDVDDGVLLCRFHHMNIHNNGYRITRSDGVYWLIPPPDRDASQLPTRLESNNPHFAHRPVGIAV